MLVLMLPTEKADVTPAVVLARRAAAVKRVERGAMVVVVTDDGASEPSWVGRRRLTNDNGIARSRVKFVTDNSHVCSPCRVRGDL